MVQGELAVRPWNWELTYDVSGYSWHKEHSRTPAGLNNAHRASVGGQRGYRNSHLLLRERVLPILELEVLAGNKVPRAGGRCKGEGEEDEAGGELHDCRSAGVW